MLALALCTALIGADVQPLLVPGETLRYEVTSARFGRLGEAVFSTEQLSDGTVRLAFDFDARVLFMTVSDHTESVVDPQAGAMLRYSKRERSPLGSHDERVVVDHATSRWTDASGGRHPLAAADALDELSMISLVRGLDIAPGAELVLRRHFDRARNPIRIRHVGRSAAADVIEMTAPDARQSGGTSTVRFELAREPGRVPLRIISHMPVAGRITMTLIPG